MSQSDQNESTGRTLSLPAALAIMTGGGLLFVQWKFDFLFQSIDEGVRLILTVGSFGAILWGAVRAFVDTPGRDARRYRFGRRRVSLPRPGQFYLVMMIMVFSGSLLGRSNMLMLVFCMMAGPFVVNGWITYSMLKRTAVDRKAPARVMADEPLSVELTLSNRKRLMSCWLLSARDTLTWQSERIAPGVLFARVPAGEHRSGHYHARLAHRGRYQFGPIKVSARFPLGIVERALVFDARGEILVYPRIGRLSSRWMRDHFLATDLVERRELRQGAFDDEFHRIREFRWGDNPRDIHWRTSARHNALMVREYHQSRDMNLTVLVDLWLPDQASMLHRERLELAASVAATICVAHMRQSRDSVLHAVLAGRRLVRWEGESRIANADPLMDEFALAEGSARPDVSKMLGHLASRRQSGNRNVLVTTRRAGTPERIELERTIAVKSSEVMGDVELLEADYAGLASTFEFA